MYTCCSKSVELLVKASGWCGVIVTEIAKSNHFKGCCSSSSSSFFYTMFHLLQLRDPGKYDPLLELGVVPSYLPLTKPSALIGFACVR